ncbi:bifunctional phosphopantothenoylcysteine decarboxylase/phosphopantothenate--cysteine ligase CoaBC [Tepidibacillus fermentans]|uniref:Coenzyme A biosynthesis bifunctional protein CoaBC n=1 Tax=Tepidibacillus fermentans TaxID=1281767 RepID=A0A4R3KKG1_9BACI|nr:bifunctional phosphopantothenoylcysteine decarboxylase/phosphopantothenate--cysteine ligase CoaBC [Tepidibacillus fermentans]TCS84363.1 phosphopantothenate-cysteine ligase /phosphopantothenoylcysteine decarboxylase [Tepidibacillus fermentans]
MKGKNILLGVSGGIAAYKAAILVSQLTKKGANVQVVMTESATKFITPLTLQTLSRNEVYLDTFAEKNPKVVSHIDIADRADLVIIAPATANIIAKLAHGIADDMLSTTLLAVQSPIIIAPAMNVHMYDHPAVKENIRILKSRGVRFIEPNAGLLACGYVGKGRLAEPEEIVAAIESYFQSSQDFKGKTFLITAGATREKIDPVRFFTNRSTGKMGYAFAEAVVERGGKVILVSGKTSLSVPANVEMILVESAEEMYQAVMNQLDNADVIIKAAAVADYRPKVVYDQKFKKGEGDWIIEMERTKDVALEVGKRKKDHQLLIGFAAESEDVIERAKGKLKKKNMDMIIANHILLEGAGFEGDTNIVTLITKEGEQIDYPMMSKKELAHQILNQIILRLEGKSQSVRNGRD